MADRQGQWRIGNGLARLIFPLLFRLDNSQAGERKGGLCILGDVYCARTVSRLMDR